MEKKSFAEKMAEKTFKSASFQKSWAVHEQAFGPILKPAFTKDFQSKIHLTAALNSISKRDLNSGFTKLQKLQNSCITDADKTAWLFFMGLCFELAGDKNNMIAHYSHANQFQHGFYLPYLKLAKLAHTDGVFEIAEKNYLSAIRCFDNMDSNNNNKRILASCHSNLASCLTMMHRYEEAQNALDVSTAILPNPNLPDRFSVQAVLYAATAQAEKVEQCLLKLSSAAPQLTEPTKKMTDEILSKNHPHFSSKEINSKLIEGFWDWFIENEEILRDLFDSEEYDCAFELLSEQMQQIFPFIKRDFEFAVTPNENVYRLETADFFTVTLREGYNKLILAHPAELDDSWEFAVVH